MINLKRVGILTLAGTVFCLSIIGRTAVAEEIKSLGTPITLENLVDVLETQRVVANLTDAVDSQRWGVVRDLLEDKVDTTIGETKPGVSRVKSKDEILSRWKGFYESAEKLVIHHASG